MTSLKGMDELFWGDEFENVTNWAKNLEMATKVKSINEQKNSKLIN